MKVPPEYHTIVKATAEWEAFVKAMAELTRKTADERQHRQRQRHREALADESAQQGGNPNG